MSRCLIALLALAAAAPAAGQEWLVNRERFRFIGTRLTIDIAAEAAGRLQVIRGEPGFVRVAGRVPVGFAASGLADDDHLTLSALGAGPVDFLVAVPEGVWITVRFPDRTRTEAVGGHTRVRSFDWAAPASIASHDPDAAGAAALLAPPEPDPAQALFTTYAAVRSPATISLPALAAIRSITIRTEGANFRVATSRPLTLETGDPDHLEIRPAGIPIDIVVEIPAGTPAFKLLAAGRTALSIDQDQVATLCTPLTQQWLSGGRRWFTFTPVDGQLQCEPGIDARHKG